MIDLPAVYERIAHATRLFVHEAGFADVVIGLSGGLDSALVATIAVDALGADHVHGVLLPGPFSSKASVDDAQELAENLKIDTLTLSIDAPYAAFADSLAAAGEPLEGTAAENTQARCRMIYIMALSNAHNWMMLNTGNKSEAAMGYSTLYGDTAGAFAPIGGIYKTDVFALARWRNDQAAANDERPLIPENIITKPPSAELSAGQTDEKSMGIDYETLDAILREAVDNKCDIFEMVAQGFELDQIQMVINRYNSYAYKRAIEPPFPS